MIWIFINPVKSFGHQTVWINETQGYLYSCNLQVFVQEENYMYLEMIIQSEMLGVVILNWLLKCNYCISSENYNDYKEFDLLLWRSVWLPTFSQSTLSKSLTICITSFIVTCKNCSLYAIYICNLVPPVAHSIPPSHTLNFPSGEVVHLMIIRW